MKKLTKKEVEQLQKELAESLISVVGADTAR